MLDCTGYEHSLKFSEIHSKYYWELYEKYQITHEQFEKAGFKNVSGYDISDWAVQQARNNGCRILDHAHGTFDLGIFLDVLEHMTDQQISDLFSQLKLNKVLVRKDATISRPRLCIYPVSLSWRIHASTTGVSGRDPFGP